jgi:hypothetical protein
MELTEKILNIISNASPDKETLLEIKNYINNNNILSDEEKKYLNNALFKKEFDARI